MKIRKKRILICVGFIVFTIISFHIREVNKPRNVVLPALGKAYAEGMVKEKECYIVRVASPDEFGTGGWYYKDGKYKKRYICVVKILHVNYPIYFWGLI